eukprot:763837-Hanusia_phi.AAC.7
MLTPIVRKKSGEDTATTRSKHAQQRRPVTAFTSLPSRPPSRLSRLTSGNVDIIDIWQSDIDLPERLTSTNAENRRVVDDSSIDVKDLSLKERLFLFYSRFAQNMRSSVEEIVAQWGSNEDVLEEVLMKRYRTNLNESGLGKTAEGIVNIDNLRKEMKAFGIQAVVPSRNNKVESRATSASKIVARDRLLLSRHGNDAEVDEEVKKFHDAFKNASGSIQHRQHLESLRPKTSGMVRMQLNLKQEIFALNTHEASTRGMRFVVAPIISKHLTSLPPSLHRIILRNFLQQEPDAIGSSDSLPVTSRVKQHVSTFDRSRLTESGCSTAPRVRPRAVTFSDGRASCNTAAEIITNNYECLIVEEEPDGQSLVDLHPLQQEDAAPAPAAPSVVPLGRRPSTEAGRRLGGKFFRRRSSVHSQATEEGIGNSRVYALMKGFQQRRRNRRTRSDRATEKSVECAVVIQTWWRSRRNIANPTSASPASRGSMMQVCLTSVDTCLNRSWADAICPQVRDAMAVASSTKD